MFCKRLALIDGFQLSVSTPCTTLSQIVAILGIASKAEIGHSQSRWRYYGKYGNNEEVYSATADPEFKRLIREDYGFLGQQKDSTFYYPILDGLRHRVPPKEWGIFQVKQRGSLPWKRVGEVHACYKWGRKVIVMFSPIGNDDFPVMYAFDLNAGIWDEYETGGAVPPWFDHPCTALYSDRFYYLDFGDTRRGNIYSLNLKTLTWKVHSTSGEAPYKAELCKTSLHINGRLWFYGSTRNDRALYILSLQEMHWRKFRAGWDVPNPNTMFALARHEGFIYALGQRGRKYREQRASLYKMNLRTLKWEVAKRMDDLGVAHLQRVSESVTFGNKWFMLEGDSDLAFVVYDFKTEKAKAVFPVTGANKAMHVVVPVVVEPGVLMLFGRGDVLPQRKMTKEEERKVLQQEIVPDCMIGKRDGFVEAVVLGREKNVDYRSGERLAKELTGFFNDKITSDVRVRVNDVSLMLHKFLLASRSEVFHNMWYKNRLDNEKNEHLGNGDGLQLIKVVGRKGGVDIVRVNTSDFKPPMIFAMVKYLYARMEEMPKDWNDLLELLRICWYFKIPSLFNDVLQYMGDHLHPEYVWEAVLVARQYKCEALWSCCLAYAENNWDEVKRAVNKARLAESEPGLHDEFVKELDLREAPPLTTKRDPLVLKGAFRKFWAPFMKEDLGGLSKRDREAVLEIVDNEGWLNVEDKYLHQHLWERDEGYREDYKKEEEDYIKRFRDGKVTDWELRGFKYPDARSDDEINEGDNELNGDGDDKDNDNDGKREGGDNVEDLKYGEDVMTFDEAHGNVHRWKDLNLIRSALFRAESRRAKERELREQMGVKKGEIQDDPLGFMGDKYGLSDLMDYDANEDNRGGSEKEQEEESDVDINPDLDESAGFDYDLSDAESEEEFEGVDDNEEYFLPRKKEETQKYRFR